MCMARAAIIRHARMHDKSPRACARVVIIGTVVSIVGSSSASGPCMQHAMHAMHACMQHAMHAMHACMHACHMMRRDPMMTAKALDHYYDDDVQLGCFQYRIVFFGLPYK